MAAARNINYGQPQQPQSQELINDLQMHRRVNTEGPFGGSSSGQPGSRNVMGSESLKGGGSKNIYVDSNDREEDGGEEGEEITDQQLMGLVDDLDGIDADQLRQMMSDPRYAALFAAHYGEQYGAGGNGTDRDEDYGDEDNEGGQGTSQSQRRQFIDLNSLSLEQQQYFLQHHQFDDQDDEDMMDDQDDYGQEEDEEDKGLRGIVGRGDGVGFFAEGDQDEGTFVKFNENANALQQRFEYDEEGRMLPEAESDYCEDLAEIYIMNGEHEDVDRYKAIHLMDKGPGYNNPDETGEKFQCNETGAHFEFLEMVRRLKRLQTLRGGIDKLIDEQIQKYQQKIIAAQKQQQLILQKQQRDQEILLQQQQQQLSPQQPVKHQRTDSAKRHTAQAHIQAQNVLQSNDLSNSSARRQTMQSNINNLIQDNGSIRDIQNAKEQLKQRLQIKQIDAALYMDKPLPTEATIQNHQETSVGAYSVYGGGNAPASQHLHQRQIQQQQNQQRMAQSAGKGQGNSKVVTAQLHGNGGITTGQYLNTQPSNHYLPQKFETEAPPIHISDGYNTTSNHHNNHQEEDENILRQQQMLLMATENDEDEIIDLLGDQHQTNNQHQTYSSIGQNTHGSISKMSVGAPMGQAQHQAQPQRKPPMTGSTQKNKKSISSGHKLFATNIPQGADIHQAPQFYTEVDEKPNRAQQIAYNNFFKVGGPGDAHLQKYSTSKHGGKRNHQLDMKTQKELELLALSQQFIDQHHSKLQTGQNNGNARNNNQYHQYATHTYFASNYNNNNTNHQNQIHQQQQQRASKRQASASGAGALGGFMSGQKQSTKKTRTGSTSHAFNTHYGGGSNTNNRASNKYISNNHHHQPQPSNAATSSAMVNGAPSQPIVMVMNPSKQTQIQNILMNFYQNTNSRQHHQYDPRLYPTKASNKHSTTTSIVGKPNIHQKQQHILVNTDGPNIGIPQTKIVSSSSHHSMSQHGQYKSFAGAIPASQHYTGGSSSNKNMMAIQKIQNKQLIMKKPGTAGPGQRNQQNNLAASNTIESTSGNNRASLPIQMASQASQPLMQQAPHHQRENTVTSNHGSRPCSAIKKKSSGISPNSKVAKQLQLGGNSQMGRQTSSKPASKGKVYQSSKYDALNPKYIQFKSRDSQHKKTNSYSMGGFGAAFSSYSKAGGKAKNSSTNYNQSSDIYQLHGGQHHQMYSTVDSLPHQQVMNGTATFIEQQHTGDHGSLLHLGGTPGSNAQGTKRSIIVQPAGSSNQMNIISQPQVYETSPPTQKQKSITMGSVGTTKGMSTTASKSRQPNHIISSGGILGSKLAGSSLVQDSQTLKMDVNAIMKKLAVRKGPSENFPQHMMPTSMSSGHHSNHYNVAIGGFEPQGGNTRYAVGGGSGMSAHHQPSMSFAGKKITAVSSHQTDGSKRLSMNMQSQSNAAGYMSKVTNTRSTFGGAVHNNNVSSSKARGSHSKGKTGGIISSYMAAHSLGGGSQTQTRQSSVAPPGVNGSSVR